MKLDNSLIDNFRDLLYNFWIVKDENEELYYKIKYNQNKIKYFVSKNLGSNLIVHNRFIKLEKIPSYTKGGEGIEGFNNVIDYVMLSLILLFLEDKARGDLFILTDLIDYIKNTAITLELNHIPDWNLRSDRKGLDAAINFFFFLSAIKLKDRDKVSFVDNKDSQALYEVTGISNYVMRLFDTPITNIDNVPDLLRLEFLNQDEEKGDVRRYKVFRDILYLPSTSTKDISNSEIDYIKKNRNYIKGELLSKLDMEVEITNNLVMLYDDTSSTLRDNFPNTKKITEIVLMVNKEILDTSLDEGNIKYNIESIIFNMTGIKDIYDKEVLKGKKNGKNYEFKTNKDYYLIDTKNDSGGYNNIAWYYKNFVQEIKYGDGTASIYTVNDKKLKEIYDKLKKNQIEYTYYKDNHIKGDINVDKGQVIFTSIPYDKDWIVKVDGKKVDTIELLDSLMGIEVKPGKHKIELEYKTHYFIPALISIVSLIVLIIDYIRKRIKQ